MLGDLQVIEHLIARYQQVLQHEPEVYPDIGQQERIAAQLLTDTERCTINGHKVFTK